MSAETLAALFTLVVLDGDPVKVKVHATESQTSSCTVEYVVRVSARRPEKVHDAHGVLIGNPVYTGIGKGTFVAAMAKPSAMDPGSLEVLKLDPVKGRTPLVPPSQAKRLAVGIFKKGLTSIPKLGMIFSFGHSLGQFIQATSPQAKPDLKAFEAPDYDTAALSWQADTTTISGGQLTDEVTVRFHVKLHDRLYGKAYLYFQTWEKVQGRLFGMKPWGMHFDLRPSATHPALTKLEERCMGRPEEHTEAGPSAPSLGPGWSSETPALSRSVPGLNFLPGHVQALAVVASPRRLFETYEVKRLFRKYRKNPGLARQREYMVRGTGFDLLDIETYRRAGIDLDAPAGAALLELKTETGVFFAQMSNRRRTLQAIERGAKRSNGTLDSHPIHGATVLCLRGGAWDHTCYVLRGKSLFVVVSDDGAEHALRWARAVASGGPARSIVEEPGFREASEALTFGTDVAAYVDPAVLMETYVSTRRHRAARHGYAVRLSDDEKVARAFAGMTRWAVGGVTLGRRGLRARVLVAPEEGSQVARAFEGRPSSHFLRALGNAPAGMAVARLNLEAARALYEELLEVGGEGVTPGEINRELRRDLGMDLSDDTLSKLTGFAGLAFILESPLSIHTKKDVLQSLGFSMGIEARDEAAAKALWNRLPALEDRKRSVVRTHDGAFEFNERAYGTTLSARLARAGSFLVATTDAAVERTLSRSGRRGRSCEPRCASAARRTGRAITTTVPMASANRQEGTPTPNPNERQARARDYAEPRLADDIGNRVVDLGSVKLDGRSNSIILDVGLLEGRMNFDSQAVGLQFGIEEFKLGMGNDGRHSVVYKQFALGKNGVVRIEFGTTAKALTSAGPIIASTRKTPATRIRVLVGPSETTLEEVWRHDGGQQLVFAPGTDAEKQEVRGGQSAPVSDASDSRAKPRPPSWSAPGLDGLFLEEDLGVSALLDLGVIANLFRPEIERSRDYTSHDVWRCPDPSDQRRMEQIERQVKTARERWRRTRRSIERSGLKLAVGELGWLGLAAVSAGGHLNLLLEYGQSSSITRVTEHALDLAVEMEKLGDRWHARWKPLNDEKYRLARECRFVR